MLAKLLVVRLNDREIFVWKDVRCEYGRAKSGMNKAYKSAEIGTEDLGLEGF